MADLYGFGPFTLDASRRTLRAGGETVPLAPKVVETLAVLVRNAGTPVSKDLLLDALWPEGFIEEGNLTQNIYVLRRTLRSRGLDGAIETLPKRGYRFVVPVVHDPSDAPRLPERQSSSKRRAVFGMTAALAACAMMLVLLTHPHEARGMSPDDARLYDLGRYFWNTRSTDGLTRSARYFAEIVQHDPANVAASAALANAYMELYDYDCAPRDCAAYARDARKYAKSAVTLAPNDPLALTAHAMVVRVLDRDYVRSDFEFRQAIAVDPHYALAHEWFGNSLLVRGRAAEASRELQAAADLEPSATANYAWLARAAYYQRNYPQAIGYAREALALTPSRVETRILLGLALQQSGKPDEALRTFDVLARQGHDATALLAGANAAEGQRTTALALLKRSGVSADRALSYITLGNDAAALHTLQHVTLADDLQRAFLAMDPRLDTVRNDQRFARWTHVPRLSH